MIAYYLLKLSVYENNIGIEKDDVRIRNTTLGDMLKIIVVDELMLAMTVVSMVSMVSMSVVELEDRYRNCNFKAKMGSMVELGDRNHRWLNGKHGIGNIFDVGSSWSSDDRRVRVFHFQSLCGGNFDHQQSIETVQPNWQPF